MFWMTKRCQIRPQAICCAQSDGVRLDLPMSIIGDQTQRADLDGGFRKKLARRICQTADLKILVMKLWLGLECLSHIERKCMNLREILPHLSGEMSRDVELLKETAKKGDTVALNVKMPDGTPVTVNAVIKAKYPHVVHMQYQTAKDM